MELARIKSNPFPDQRTGTAGLRRKVTDFQQPGYLESFLQAVIECVPELRAGRIVVGGDGRYWNREAIQTLLRIAAANGIAAVTVGGSGLLSTPAASVLIRAENAQGGFILTASHNPGGPDGDFGIKFNTSTGGQASERLSAAIADRCSTISTYQIATGTPDVDLERPGTVFLGEMRIDIVDPVAAYAELMESLFDFDLIRSAVKNGLTMRFDAMNAVTGPYASKILVERLGFSPLSLLRATPREDFAGIHPDPTPATVRELLALAHGEDVPDLLAASDGDGDRNLVAGRGGFVSPGDSLAIMAANAHLIPGYRDGIVGIARSMPTSRAADRVAAALRIPCHETPTGWRYFCNLLEDKRISLCGEESFGTSSAHCREKDGIWAVLFWLNLIATRKMGVAEILADHWARFGRTFFLRHDYYIADRNTAESLMAGLRDNLAGLTGGTIGGLPVTLADEFRYLDPVDGSISEHQGLRVLLGEHARIVYRMSGTDTRGATLRVYLEAHSDDPARYGEASQDALASLAEAARDLARVTQLAGLAGPTTVV